MRLQDFIEQIERDPPYTLRAIDLRRVSPKPWVLRAGSGNDARIRMICGAVRYERQQGEDVWHLSKRTSDFDIEEPA